MGTLQGVVKKPTHNGDVSPATGEQVRLYFQDRLQEHLASGRFPDQDDALAKVNEEMASYPGEAFWATCSCGWAGNNPYPDRESAVSSLDKHYRSAGVKK